MYIEVHLKQVLTLYQRSLGHKCLHKVLRDSRSGMEKNTGSSMFAYFARLVQTYCDDLILRCLSRSCLKGYKQPTGRQRSELRHGATQQTGCDGVTRMHEIVHFYGALVKYMQPLGIRRLALWRGRLLFTCSVASLVNLCDM